MLTVEPRVHLWTREEYYRMADAGLFEGKRVERIGGEIVEMSPQRNLHSAGIEACAECLRVVFGKGFWVRQQFPLELGMDSDPEPDVAVVAGTRKEYKQHPTSALLVLEVSDTSLAYDRGKKASLYARAGIQDYWILNLADRKLEILRKPVPDAAQPFGFRYSDATALSEKDLVSPFAKPEARIKIADLLP